MYMETIFYIYWFWFSWPIQLDEVATGVHSPLHCDFDIVYNTNDVVAVIRRVLGQLNKNVAFVKFKFGAFEIVN